MKCQGAPAKQINTSGCTTNTARPADMPCPYCYCKWSEFIAWLMHKLHIWARIRNRRTRNGRIGKWTLAVERPNSSTRIFKLILHTESIGSLCLVESGHGLAVPFRWILATKYQINSMVHFIWSSSTAYHSVVKYNTTFAFPSAPGVYHFQISMMCVGFVMARGHVYTWVHGVSDRTEKHSASRR